MHSSHLNVIQESTFAHKVTGFQYKLIRYCNIDCCNLGKFWTLKSFKWNNSLCLSSLIWTVWSGWELLLSTYTDLHKKINILSNVNWVIKYETFVPSKFSSEYWVADRAGPVQRRPRITVYYDEQKENLIWWTVDLSWFGNSLYFSTPCNCITVHFPVKRLCKDRVK